MQHVFQVNEAIRSVMASYDDVTSVALLPTNNGDYLENEVGCDELAKLDIDKLDFILGKCDGFIVPGGTNWYCFDEYVIKHAIKYDKPLLAICVGFQALCSMFAVGRNKFDMTKRLDDRKHYGVVNEYRHENYVLKNTKLEKILGSECLLVNSLHHDCVDFDMNKMNIGCYSEDGIIEAVEVLDVDFIVGIQWHPEYLKDENSMKIFDCFVDRIIRREKRNS